MKANTPILLAIEINREPVASLDAAHKGGNTAFPYISKVEDDMRLSEGKAVLDVIFSAGAVRITGNPSEVERAYHASREGFLSGVRANAKLGIEKVEIIRMQKDDAEGQESGFEAFAQVLAGALNRVADENKDRI